MDIGYQHIIYQQYIVLLDVNPNSFSSHFLTQSVSIAVLSSKGPAGLQIAGIKNPLQLPGGTAGTAPPGPLTQSIRSTGLAYDT